jgi:hypothetical protein
LFIFGGIDHLVFLRLTSEPGYASQGGIYLQHISTGRFLEIEQNRQTAMLLHLFPNGIQHHFSLWCERPRTKTAEVNGVDQMEDYRYGEAK